MDSELQADREALAGTVRRFAEVEIAPHVQAWDDAGEFPRAL
jgi:acyl-CoA dehydrogenase